MAPTAAAETATTLAADEAKSCASVGGGTTTTTATPLSSSTAAPVAATVEANIEGRRQAAVGSDEINNNCNKTLSPRTQRQRQQQSESTREAGAVPDTNGSAPSSKFDRPGQVDRAQACTVGNFAGATGDDFGRGQRQQQREQEHTFAKTHTADAGSQFNIGDRIPAEQTEAGSPGWRHHNQQQSQVNGELANISSSKQVPLASCEQSSSATEKAQAPQHFVTISLSPSAESQLSAAAATTTTTKAHTTTGDSESIESVEQRPIKQTSAGQNSLSNSHSNNCSNKQLKSGNKIISSPPVQATTTTTITPVNSDAQQANQETLFLNRFELISSSGRKLVPHELCLQKQNLSYLQGLLIRKWPFLPLAILAMFTTLIVGVLLALDGRWCALQADAGTRPVGSELSLSSPMISSHKLLMELEHFGPSSNGGAGEFGASVHSHGSGSSSPVGDQSLGPADPVAGGNNRQAKAASNFQRLPTSVWPIHYDLFMQPYIAEPFNFTGKVSIRLECREPTDNITLHSIDLAFNESSLSLELVDSNKSKSSAQIKIKGLSQDKQLQHSIISLEEKLEAGREYVLEIDFKGTLHEDLSGFYKIKYEQQNSTEPTWIAATQFQATDARRAFPCFDEPNYKATFSIQIKHWKNMTALSNMPIIDRQDSADGLWVTDSFNKSHRMSTYLVAFAVTNFESRTDGNISVWTRPGFTHTAEYALKVAKKILSFYESFFGIDYPLPKMDMIALPDFNAGAMENWGLITYRETTMLYDEISSSIVNKQRVAVVVAHELAHQWFGNLVTPKWWDDLWLNEGFASYVEYIGVDHIEPGWRMLDQFVVDEVHNVLKLDSLSSSHQISIPVTNPDEISEIFDHISYAKGASVIRMMGHFLTEQVFKTGLTRYLRALKYSNAEQSDLWAHLTEAQKLSANSSSSSAVAAVNVEKVMNSWTLQTGYPLVTLTRQYNGSRQVTLDQIHYQPYKFQQANLSITADGSGSQSLAKASGLSNQRWEIPITFTSKSELKWEPRTRLWLHQNDSQPLTLSAKSEFNLKADDEWILVNIDQTGYYRVNYDLRNWKLLIDQLDSNHKVIKNTNRAQILDDLFELARGSVIDYRFAMEATKYLRSEKDYLPWDTVLSSFSYIDDMLQRTAIYGDWKEYLQALIAPYYARYKDLDWNSIRGDNAQLQGSTNGMQTNNSNETVRDDNDLIEQYNHANAIHWACAVDEHCIQKAKALFKSWKQGNKNLINPAFRHTVYCTAIGNGNKDDWNFLWKVYEKEQNASEKDRLMRSLCCSKETWILARYLEWTFDKTKSIRRQDGAYVFRLIAKNIHGRDIAFNFMRERWSTIKEFYGKSSFALGNLIRSVAYLMNTQVELNQLVTFYEAIKNDVGNGKRSFQIAIEEVESNVAWKNRNYKILGDWLAEVRGKMSTSNSLRASNSRR